MYNRFSGVLVPLKIELLDLFLERFTMHRLTLYSLIALILWALALSLVGVLHYSALDIAGGAALAVGVSLAVNLAFARILHATTDMESTVIMALILVLIVTLGLAEHAVFIAAASAVATASKYIVTVDKQHVFNPAALALVALGLLFPRFAASWWVGTVSMLPAVLVFGTLVAHKTRRVGLVLTFFVVYGAIITAAEIADGQSFAAILEVWNLDVVHTSLLFFVLFMMTDPITIPWGRLAKPAYVSLVALLYASQGLLFMPFALLPEQALCVGNAMSFFISPKCRLDLRLKRKYKVGADTWAFQYGLPQRISFKPGQFMEWTLPHANADGRGKRRYFTIASSPTEKDITIVMRVPTPCSSYKRALVNASEGSSIVAARLAGDFVLPHNMSRPLAFVAGGVGIAPFSSMVQYILDRGIKCDIVLLYANRHADEILFRETFEQATPLGLRTVYVLTGNNTAPKGWEGRLGRISADMVKTEIPDYQQRSFYISGSPAMVRAMEVVLKELKVPRKHIHTDYFEGSVDD